LAVCFENSFNLPIEVGDISDELFRFPVPAAADLPGLEPARYDGEIIFTTAASLGSHGATGLRDLLAMFEAHGAKVEVWQRVTWELRGIHGRQIVDGIAIAIDDPNARIQCRLSVGSADPLEPGSKPMPTTWTN
jgi:hypothetical protein